MENTPKSQVIERLREAQNVLVTVSTNPSVDQLSAAIGFTLLMNKLGKHATAVFSGQVPSTLEFLKPTETLEQNTDSLRDFIIALDKSKADKLRYKVEEDVVRIFITPYRTSLSEADLDFSQGDFNVDVVVALGVDKQEHLDQAIVNHGRILHDATVIGVMAGDRAIELGGINWQESSASSLCEMLVSISEAFQSGLLDGQMATAFLTGIVAETERFSNDKTSPKVMTMSAQLMAAGANQQLIATELQHPTAFSDSLPSPVNEDETVVDLHQQEQEPVDNIKISQEGELTDTDELAKTVNEVQENSEQVALNHEKQIDPLGGSEEDKLSEFVTQPPEHSGTFTANTKPEPFEQSTNPLVSEVTEGYAADKPKEVIEPFIDNASTQSPLISVDDDAESVSPVDIPSTPDFMLPSDGEDQAKPLGPEVQATDTLDNIEHAVEEFSGEPPHTEQHQENATDDARRAVMDAVGNGFDPNRPTPIDSLNAQEFPVDESQPQLPPEPASGAPPEVPPPMMPPFPIPGAEVIEPPEDDFQSPTAPPVV